jgi:hypothetical protein
MKCRTCQHLLTLSRKGELDLKQEIRMDRHINSCSECSQAKRRIGNVNAKLSYLRKGHPYLSQPEALTDSIMHQIRGQSRRRESISTAGSVWEFFLFPKIRLSLTVLIVLVVSSFFVQEFLVLNRLSRLEEKIAEQSPSLDRLGSAMNTSVGFFNQSRYLETFTSLMPLVREESGLDEWILVHRKALLSRIETNYRLQDAQERLLDTLKTYFPDLKTVSLRDGLDGEELQLLRRNKNRIIQTLYSL